MGRRFLAQGKSCVRPTKKNRRVPTLMGCASPGFFQLFRFRFLSKGPFSRTSLTDKVHGMMLSSRVTHHVFNEASIMKRAFGRSFGRSGIINIMHRNDCLLPTSCKRVCVPCSYLPKCSDGGSKDRGINACIICFGIHRGRSVPGLCTRIGRLIHGCGASRGRCAMSVFRRPSPC